MTALSTRFVGKRIARQEDARFLTGHGCYVDDVQLPNTLHVAFARSDIAARRASCRSTPRRRRRCPVSRPCYVASDLNHLVHRLAGRRRAALGTTGRFRVLADGDVRFVGDPIAMVVAESRYLAEDAVDAIEIDIDALPAVLDCEHALDADAPVVHPETGSNLHGEHPGRREPRARRAARRRLRWC